MEASPLWPRTVKSRPLLGVYDHCRDLYRTTTAVTRDRGFISLIGRQTPFNNLLRQAQGLWTYSFSDLHGMQKGCPKKFNLTDHMRSLSDNICYVFACRKRHYNGEFLRVRPQNRGPVSQQLVWHEKDVWPHVPSKGLYCFSPSLTMMTF